MNGPEGRRQSAAAGKEGPPAGGSNKIRGQTVRGGSDAFFMWAAILKVPGARMMGPARRPLTKNRGGGTWLEPHHFQGGGNVSDYGPLRRQGGGKKPRPRLIHRKTGPGAGSARCFVLEKQHSASVGWGEAWRGRGGDADDYRPISSDTTISPDKGPAFLGSEFHLFCMVSSKRFHPGVSAEGGPSTKFFNGGESIPQKTKKRRGGPKPIGAAGKKNFPDDSAEDERVLCTGEYVPRKGQKKKQTFRHARGTFLSGVVGRPFAEAKGWEEEERKKGMCFSFSLFFLRRGSHSLYATALQARGDVSGLRRGLFVVFIFQVLGDNYFWNKTPGRSPVQRFQPEWGRGLNIPRFFPIHPI